MPYRRNYRKRRTTRRGMKRYVRTSYATPVSFLRKRSMRLKKALTMGQNIGNGLYYFKANVFASTTFQGNSLDPGWSSCNVFTVTPGSIPTLNELSSVFDQYKIKKIWCTMTYKGGNVDDIDDVLTGGIQFPTVYWIQDRDDAGLITSAQLQEHSVMRKFQFGNGARMKFNFAIPPYVKNALAGIDSSVLVAEQVKRSPWIDYANTTIKHGCTKMLLRADNLQSSDDSYKFDIDYHIIFEARTVR